MKSFFTLLAVTMSSVCSFSQNANIIVFTENGEKFTLLLNGEKKNEAPTSNVKVQGLTAEWYQARIDFEDSKLADFSQNNFGVHLGMEVTYIIKVNKKGEYVLRFQSEVPIGSSATSSNTTPISDAKKFTTVDDTDVPPAPVEEKTTITTNTNIGGTGVNQNVNVNGNTTTTTTKTTTTANPENVDIKMNVGGVNMGLNVNMTGMNLDVNGQESTTTTTTTTSSSTNVGGNTTTTTTPKPRQEIVEEAPAPTGCGRPMDKTSFDAAVKSITDKSFEDSKLTLSKQVLKSNCMSAAQILSVMRIFSFEETRLDFAKFAYDRCSDQGNYFQVNDGFTFESSIEELDSYIQSK